MTKQSLKKENFAVVLTGGEKKTAVLSALKYSGWLEFRVDEFLKNYPEKNLNKWFATCIPLRPLGKKVSMGDKKKDEDTKVPVKRIGTVRYMGEHQSEGLDMPEKRRLEIYENIAGCVDFLDVEINSSIAGAVIGLADKKGKKVIASYHNFSRTPSLNNLEMIYRKGRKLHPDVIKVATLVHSRSDLFVLLSFTSAYAKEFPLIVIPMGVPALERLMPLSFGSLFTYVAINRETAPGQISCKQVNCLISVI